MSGGVDSSVAAALLAEQGHDVIGVSMQLYDQREGQTSFGSCCTIDDLHDARRVAAKPDSQEICFVPDNDYASFVAKHAPDAARGGTIVDEQGHVLGGHAGIHRFTVGQRKGLGLSTPATHGTPMYVLALHPSER